MHAFVSTLSKDAWMWYYGLPDKSITSLKCFLEMFYKRCHNGQEDKMTALKKGFDQLKWIREQIEQHFHDDLIEKVYQNSDTVEDPPYDRSTENIEDWGSFHDYFSDDDHIYTPDPPQEETIIEVYNESYEEIREVCNVYDDTPPCSPLRDEVLENFTTCMKQ